MKMPCHAAYVYASVKQACRPLIRGVLMAGAVAAAGHAPAFAQAGVQAGAAASEAGTSQLPGNDEIAALRAEIAELKLRLAVITAKVEASANPQGAKPNDPALPENLPKTAPAQTARALVATATAVKPAAAKAAAPFEIAGDGWSFRPRARIHYDVGSVNAPSAIPDSGATDGLGFGSEARRIWIGAEGGLPGGFGYRLDADLSAGPVVLRDVLLLYRTGKWSINIGHHKPFFGLEELISANDTSFTERSAWTDAFNFDRRVGISAEYLTGPILLQGGIFTDNIAALNDDGNNAIAFSARGVLAPKLGEAQLHFGASFQHVDLGDAIIEQRYRQRPFSRIADIRFIDTGPLNNAASESGYGLEAAVVAGRFHASAESYWLTLNRTDIANPTFFGGSVEAGLFLTNDTRRYRGGTFRGLDVGDPVNSGGLGALQINLRYDHLDLNDGGIIGGIQNSYQASVIWTPINYVRFLFNYARLDYTDAVIAAGGDRDFGVDAFVARTQVAF